MEAGRRLHSFCRRLWCFGADLLTSVASPNALQEALEQRAREVQVAHADENHQMLKDAV